MERKKIMLIDWFSLRKIGMCYNFNEHPYNCIGVSPEEAISIYNGLTPDLVLTDIIMGDADGIECSREIISHNPKAKIVILSMYILPETMMSALELGIQDIIHRLTVNPADYNDVLYDKVRDALLCSRNYDLAIVRNKLSTKNPLEPLSPSEIDDVLLSSQI